MRSAGTVIVILLLVYFAVSIFTPLLPGRVGSLPRMVWSSLLYTLSVVAQIMGLPPEYILILSYTAPQR